MTKCEIVLASDNHEDFLALARACDNAGLNLDMLRAVRVSESSRDVPRNLPEARELAKAKTLGVLKRDDRMIVSVSTCLISEAGEPPYSLALIYIVLPQGGDDFFLSDPIPNNSHWVEKRLILAEAISQAFDRL